MSKKLSKRFYKTVSVEAEGAGFVVKLDQYTLRTPGKKPLVFTRKDHAQYVADEWDAQVENVRPETMSCTRLYNVVVERTPETREAVIGEGVKYTSTDVICYREGGGTALSRYQTEQWDPILKWANDFGIELASTDSLIATDAAPSTLVFLKTYLEKRDDLNLTLAVHFIATLGSVVLGIAVLEKHLSAKEAFRLSRLDELWQIAQWGEVDDAKDRADEIEAELVALARLLE